MPRQRLPLATCLLGLCAVAALTARAQADAVSDFYRGKAVTIIVGYTAGGGYDLYARALGRHMGRHLPGNPNFIVQNITGAGSLNAANHIYNVSAKDGTVFLHVLDWPADGVVRLPLAAPVAAASALASGAPVPFEQRDGVVELSPPPVARDEPVTTIALRLT